MLLLHTDTDKDGNLFFMAEMRNAGDDAGRRLSGNMLLESIREMFWFQDGFAPIDDARPDCVQPTWANILMFLSDVRGRRFKRGVFLSGEVLAHVDEFRSAARIVAAGHCLPGIEKRDGCFAAVWRPLAQGSAFFCRCVDELARRAGRTALETGTRHETAEDAWLSALRSDNPLVGYGKADEVANLAERLAVWNQPVGVSPEDRAALCFVLKPPEAPDGDWRLDYKTPVTRKGLVSLGQAIRLFPPISADVFRKEDAEAFLRTGASTLAAAGFAVSVPDGMTGEHVIAEADLVPVDGRKGDKGFNGPNTTEDLKALRQIQAKMNGKTVSTKLTVRVDGEIVDENEIAFLLEQNSPLVFFRNCWIEVDRNILKEALRALRETNKRRLSARESLSWLLGARRSRTLKIAAARAHGWLRGLVNELKGGEGFRVLPPPAGLSCDLRDYQLRGYSWLAFLCRLGFGPCLADDMGLGKTVQTIAWILSRKESGEKGTGPVLIVAPVSVTTNWVRELSRFAPGLRVLLHQGEDRPRGGFLASRCRRVDVVVTGYSLLVKDFRDLRDAAFSALVLDEAQIIKNPDTRVARAACGLDVPVRIALTGTPLENSAQDLWSIEEFLNPGLLGERRDFMDTYGRDLAPSSAAGMAAAAASKLRHALAPFMLRRLKSDPSIAAELGDKREIREYCALSADQRREYEDALRRFRDETSGVSDVMRRGRMLALLTELKQVCDGDGKLARLEDLLEEIFAAGESALVFTQYVRVARRIREHLAETFGRSFPFLHGGLSPAARENEIAAFNADKAPNAFLVSLKAGGFGLNLTRATHVIHFDRWWNPAVENQATDRAHRIGQTNTVFVHLFICAGTLEDRIDSLLEEKRRLAGDVVASGESFLAKMSDEEFERTVALS